MISWELVFFKFLFGQTLFFYHILQVFCLSERKVGNFVESKAGHFFCDFKRQKRKWNSFPAFEILIEGLIPKLSPFWLYVCGCVCKLAWLGNTAAAAAKSLQSCPSLCDPIDGSPTGSLVPGTLQARTLEWVAISFSNA